jgi:leucyl-tRNA synthetase
LAQTFISPDDSVKRNLEGASKGVSTEELERQKNLTIKAVTDDIMKEFGFNTAISRVMELVNVLYLYPELGDAVSKSAVETVVQLLQPFAPHMAEELWEKMGHKELLAESPWPSVDVSKMAAKNIEIVVQVNGKLRDKITVPAQAKEPEVKELAGAALQKKGIDIGGSRVVFVPHRLVNFVTGKN